MPYNNTPIAPAKEITGHVSLPLARVQKIITADPNHLTVSKNASFAIALATEMFIQHLATTTHNVVKAERKPRRNIQYRDVSSAVGKTDNLEFLVDVVPRTSTWGVVRRGGEAGKKKTATGEGKGKSVAEDGEDAVPVQSREDATLEERIDGHVNAATTNAKPATNPVAISTLLNGHTHPNQSDPMDLDNNNNDKDTTETPPQNHDDSETEDDPAAMQIEMEMRGPPQQVPSPEVRRTSGFTAINGSR
ncbi:hypothetical protein T440DRAFT_484085 [Plenodomus tracheiphilus IPT5]|uniref:Transcription factor CBF/NF-Y/archaeal histone domain-containing protein n=1 Tax=Plenodomus tracheiphilus IPT5 TaxID=1408161 RepID=A0A6A7AP70_9PLEO|nr:hypothetical protein T440DRAFT_484085 [Plenodomus tracheiphilus IPT5]